MLAHSCVLHRRNVHALRPPPPACSYDPRRTERVVVGVGVLDGVCVHDAVGVGVDVDEDEGV